MLVYYKKENVTFAEQFSKKLDSEEATIILKKMKMHYKLIWLRFGFTNRIRVAGKCFEQQYIQLKPTTSIGVICHEIAHALYYRKYGKTGHSHNKKHWRLMKGVMAYCKKKNYWQEELQKRLAPKPIKPESTKEELKLAKIERTKTNLKKANSKLKFWSNKVRKYQKRIRLMERKAILSVSVQVQHVLSPTILETQSADACPDKQSLLP